MNIKQMKNRNFVCGLLLDFPASELRLFLTPNFSFLIVVGGGIAVTRNFLFHKRLFPVLMPRIPADSIIYTTFSG